MNGFVKTLNTEKMFGFIKAEDGQDYFFHKSGMANPHEFAGLRKRQEVEFEPGEGDGRGPRAEQVILRSN